MDRTILFCIFIIIAISVPGQDREVEDIGSALRSSSAKELIKFCVDRVEIEIDGKRGVYGKPQAEVVLKQFFSKNVAKGFRYVHQGSSPEGPRYTIGSYALEEGSYRVYMLLKKIEEGYLIDTISFTRE